MTRRPTALATVSAVLLAGVAAAASHTSVWAPAREGTLPLLERVALVAAMLFLGVAVAGLVLFVQGRRRAHVTPLRERARRAAPATIASVALMSLLALSQTDLRTYRRTADVPRPDLSSGREGVRLRMDWGGSAVRRAGEGEEAGSSETFGPDGPPLLLWGIVAVGIVGLVALTTAWWSTRRRTGRPGATFPPPDARREAARTAVVRSIDSMLADPDPRTAVIGAYARLLEELSVNGAPRRAHEAPMEHLRRVLTVLDVRTEPLEHLIRLFAEARFSRHALTSSHRDQALEALRAVAADLAAPADVAPAGSGR